jgi:hypothetical protein
MPQVSQFQRTPFSSGKNRNFNDLAPARSVQQSVEGVVHRTMFACSYWARVKFLARHECMDSHSRPVPLPAACNIRLQTLISWKPRVESRPFHFGPLRAGAVFAIEGAELTFGTYPDQEARRSACCGPSALSASATIRRHPRKTL